MVHVRVFFSRILHFCIRFHPLHLRYCTYVKVQRIPVMDIRSDFRYRRLICFSVIGQRAFTYLATAFQTYLFRRNVARGIRAGVYLAFLTKLINCIKRTRSTTLRVRFSLLRIRINYSGTI